ncbi:hypothetical protein GGE06_004776 [Streptomyces sp. SFB5A]|uniref:Transposase n=1 Tax=Streptomyces nymphaeiformis TaxID=2663842 RepID=A0A7W7U2G8_9ACTN|nr:hypothetical protein [Streptomyces nymphaeiformis]
MKTWKASRAPDYAAKKARVEHPYAIADGEVMTEADEPEVVFCMDEFGPLDLRPAPTNSSWLNRIEAQFTALRYFALDGTGHASHKEQGSMIRRCITWRNKHAADERLHKVVTRTDVA